MYQSSKRQKNKRKDEQIIDIDDIDDDEDESNGMPDLLLDDPELDELDLFEDLEFKNYHKRNKSVDVDEFISDLWK